jgi:hypothetical protein
VSKDGASARLCMLFGLPFEYGPTGWTYGRDQKAPAGSVPLVNRIWREPAIAAGSAGGGNAASDRPTVGGTISPGLTALVRRKRAYRGEHPSESTRLGKASKGLLCRSRRCQLHRSIAKSGDRPKISERKLPAIGCYIASCAACQPILRPWHTREPKPTPKHSIWFTGARRQIQTPFGS